MSTQPTHQPQPTAAPPHDAVTPDSAPGPHPTIQARHARIGPGQAGRAAMPYSEVMMHLHLAGTVADFQVTIDGTGVQLVVDGRPCSFPVLPAEGGLRHHPDGGYWYQPAAEDLPGAPPAPPPA